MTTPFLDSSLRGRSLIGGDLGGDSAGIFHGINPATEEKLDPPYHTATLEETRRAARLAGEAFAIYRRTTGAQRAAFLREIASQIETLGDALIKRAALETALPDARLNGERDRTCGQLRMFANLVEEGSWVNARIDQGNPERKPLPKPDIRWMLQAIGPVAVFGPANFPLAFGVAGGDTASALASGCPVVVKAHPSHPGTSELVGHAVRRAVIESGFPEGVFSLLFDSGKEAGIVLVGCPEIKAVGFTGSQRAGRALYDLAASRSEPIPVFAEMSSINPVFILPGALRERGDRIAEGLQASVTLGVGQFCTNPGLVLMEKSPASEEFSRRLAGLMAGSPSGIMLNRNIRTAYDNGLAKWRSHAKVQVLVAPGESGVRASAALFQTDASTFFDNPELAEEIFGPATLMVRGTRDELLRVAAKLEGQLTATVHGTDEDFGEYQDLISVLETKAGRLLFNGYPTGVEVCSSMNHGGPYPATTDSRFTSVGTAAIYRFARPICYQNCTQAQLPPELRDGNPLKIRRSIDGKFDAAMP
ncbi:MAG: aldehyde dehydrogenase (NADP(+)) [Methylacidiphilales bacterium]|nr:aldehyde dehydrogenase (NADP(+)) [Candidatus Methylacidiphilales bacterium]